MRPVWDERLKWLAVARRLDHPVSQQNVVRSPGLFEKDLKIGAATLGRRLRGVPVFVRSWRNLFLCQVPLLVNRLQTMSTL